MTTNAVSYVIDDRDLLVKLDSGYYDFALENGWQEAGHSLGRSLWDYVAGTEMRKLQRMLLRRIRDEVRAVELPFRCESPGARREMEIRIVANPSGRLVQFSARVKDEEAREVFQPLLDPTSPRASDLLEMCGWCDRFMVEASWVEVEQAAARLDLFSREALPTISHGICPECSELLLAA